MSGFCSARCAKRGINPCISLVGEAWLHTTDERELHATDDGIGIEVGDTEGSLQPICVDIFLYKCFQLGGLILNLVLGHVENL
jgi:hypothetical protein